MKKTFFRKTCLGTLTLCLTFNLAGCALLGQQSGKGEKDTKVKVKEELVAQEKTYASPKKADAAKLPAGAGMIAQPSPDQDGAVPPFNTEAYSTINENPFLEAIKTPLSTFSIDVDTASYSNVRRFLNQSQLPPKDAVRIEELVNYFDYDYPAPESAHPFSLVTELSACPWNTKHKLLHVGLQGKQIATQKLPPSNLVFLLDVSGSMADANKLPLLKRSFRLLLENLREQDKVSIVVYAGAAGLVLPATSAAKRDTILEALDRLEAGGSTAGGAGIQLAYQVAKENFIKEGNNRIILATDGDFNIGASSDAEMERMIEEKRKQGIFLTVLGFGMGNYKDSKMETLADKGNGNYAYIDSIIEAKKVLVSEMGGTLLTIAKDVKLQLEFNPAKVSKYRLIGYENRLMQAHEFDDDKKDAGELGSGHAVTALYEIEEADAAAQQQNNLKYQTTVVKPESQQTNELLTIKLRYKQPTSDTSQLLALPVLDKGLSFDRTSENFRFSAAVAGFGMLLRQSQFKGDLNFSTVKTWAEKSVGSDHQGYRREFVTLIEKARLLSDSQGHAPVVPDNGR